MIMQCTLYSIAAGQCGAAGRATDSLQYAVSNGEHTLAAGWHEVSGDYKRNKYTGTRAST